MPTCEKCNTKHNGEYGTGRFCNQSCAKSYATLDKRKQINSIVSKKLQGRGEQIKIVCPVCGTKRTLSYKRRRQKTCSKKCGNFWRFHQDNPSLEYNLNVARRAGQNSAKSQSESRRSKNEIHFANLCLEKFDSVECNSQKFDCWDADVIINDLKVAVLWNGKWHYEKCANKHSVKQVQNRDKLKIKSIKDHGYQPYVIKDMGKEDKNFVEEQFNIFLRSNRLS